MEFKGDSEGNLNSQMPRGIRNELSPEQTLTANEIIYGIVQERNLTGFEVLRSCEYYELLSIKSN
jgi:hypothetical protein